MPAPYLLVSPDELRVVLDLPGADDTELTPVCEAATEVVWTMLRPEDDHEMHSWDREAALAVAVQVYASRSAPGGQMVAADFTQLTTPHLLGPGLYARVKGLTRPCAPGGGMSVA